MHYKLRLFVTGGSPNSRRALATLEGLVDREFQDAAAVDVEVIDILQQPELAGEARILATPTLVKLAPPPICHLIGDLSDSPRVLAALGKSPVPRRNTSREKA